jgi:hypothetical protein
MKRVSFGLAGPTAVQSRSPRSTRQNQGIMQASKGCEPEVHPPSRRS